MFKNSELKGKEPEERMRLTDILMFAFIAVILVWMLDNCSGRVSDAVTKKDAEIIRDLALYMAESEPVDAMPAQLNLESSTYSTRPSFKLNLVKETNPYYVISDLDFELCVELSVRHFRDRSMKITQVTENCKVGGEIKLNSELYRGA